MARFDVYQHGLSSGLVVDVQSNFLTHIRTRVVVPLVKHGGPLTPTRYMNPIFEVNQQQYIFLAQSLAAIPKEELGEPIANLDAYFDQISRAIDMVFQGF